MAKYKLTGGGEFETTTPEELSRALNDFGRDWVQEAAKGPRFIRFSAYATVDSAGVVEIGGLLKPDDRTGPDQSLMWSVKRIAISNLEANKTVDMYINGQNFATLVKAGITGYEKFGSNELVLQPSERLYLTGSTMTAARSIYLSGAALELPASMAHRLR